jgi:IS5 family transposase
MMLDATCAPANITYPTDVNLLNEAREKLEEIIDTLHPHTGNKLKPRTYRREARRKYLQFIRNRNPQKKIIRKAIGQQLRYAARNLRHIDKQLQAASIDELSNNQQAWLETIRILYQQQQQMYDTRTHSVENRIVSISQPHVRPIVRGKKNADVEFGAKPTVSLIDGYAFIEKLAWEAYNEESTLIPAIEKYKERVGVYPEAVLADKIFRNRENRAYCKERDIRISGPRLGRPAKETQKAVIALERKDASARNAIEGKFGEGKTGYGLDRIMARLKETSETVIAMSFLCMNLNRKLRVLLRYFYQMQKWLLGGHDFWLYGVFG